MPNKIQSLVLSCSQHNRYAALFLEWGLMVCAAALMLSWPLNHTIALRNISLGTGFLLSIFWLLICKPQVKFQFFLPVLLLFCVPLWLVINLFFFPVAPLIQLNELSSLWLRVILALPFAFSFGVLIRRRPLFIKLLIAISCIYPFIPVAMELFAQMPGETWRPASTYIFKTKVSGVYWLMWSCSLGFAILHYLLLSQEDLHAHDVKKKAPSLFLASALVIFSMIDFLLLNALNGLLVGLASGFVLIYIYIHKLLFLGQLKLSKLYLVTFVTVFIGVFGVGVAYKEFSVDFNNKLVPLYWDIKASLSIDKTKTWQRGDQVSHLPDPMNDMGAVVNVSTYERTSWLIKGGLLLLENPLGTGYTSEAFHGYMIKEYPGSTVQKTHSGWLDLALGLGIPGLFFLYLAIGRILFSSYQAINVGQCGINLAILWMLGSMATLWFPAELGEREYIESLFYMIALFAGAHVRLSDGVRV